jgi:hypothetical protein
VRRDVESDEEEEDEQGYVAKPVKKSSFVSE